MEDEISAEAEPPFLVTDIKQWVYCPRILYYRFCLPDIRPITYKMELGKEEGRKQEELEKRRSLRAFGLRVGRREFNVSLSSPRYGLRGKVDLVIWSESPHEEEIIPVDFKYSKIPGAHFKLQLMAYGLLLEDMYRIPSKRGFIYLTPQRRSEEVKFHSHLRENLLETLENMHKMLISECMPSHTRQRSKCLSCEFRRFCNDIE